MLDDILSYARIGLATHLLYKRSKRPIGDEWSTVAVATEDDLRRDYKKGMNCGVRLGEWSVVDGYFLMGIDLDIRDPALAKEAMAALKELFPNYRSAWSVRSGSGGASRHYYFLTDTPMRSANLERSFEFVEVGGKRRRAWEIDLMGTGKQAVLPPSIHPISGKPYEWINSPIDDPVGPLIVNSDDLFDLTEGLEDDNQEKEPLGCTLDKAREYLEWVQDWADDREQWRNVGFACKHEFGDAGWPLFDEWSRKGIEYDERENKYQWKSFKNNRNKLITMRSVRDEAEKRGYVDDDILDDFDDLGESGEADDAEERDIADEFDDLDDDQPRPAPENKKPLNPRGDPDISILTQATIAPPAFPLKEVFGKDLTRRLRETADSASAPVDYVVASLLACSATAIGNAIIVEIKPGYTQPATLWAMIIGSPSAKKSPALKFITAQLASLEGRYAEAYATALKVWQQKKATADRFFKAWETKIKKLMAAGELSEEDAEPPSEAIAPEEPPRRPFIVNDTTLESFMMEQSRSPRGFMLLSDELTGWIRKLEGRYSPNGGDRQAWLESYDAGPHTYSRVKHDGMIRVERLFAPVLGGIQPDRLVEVASENAADDGLMARFMPFWPAESLAPFDLEGCDTSWAFRLLENLAELELPVDRNGKVVPRVAKMTRKALEHFAQWSDHHRKAEQYEQTRLQSMYGKADGLVARLALVLEYLWWAAESDEFDPIDPPTEISLEAVEAAITMREKYIKVMQRRVIQAAAEDQDVVNARKIAQWIVNGKVKTFNARQMKRQAGIKGISSWTSNDAVDEALALLQSLKWINQEEHKGAGRKAKNYIVNSRLWEKL